MKIENLEGEIWKDIDGFIGEYQISNMGRVKSLERFRKGNGDSLRKVNEIIMNPETTKDGHQRVCLRKVNRQRAFVHTLVLNAFVGARPTGMVCCHWDGNPSNNKAENLRWGTLLDNAKDSIRQGRQVFGERHYYAKLKNSEVQEIKKLLSFGITQNKIAKMFKVVSQTINNINTGYSWSRA